MVSQTPTGRKRAPLPPSPIPRLALTFDEARAALGGVSEHTLRELIRRGKIATVRYSEKVIRVPVFAIEEYLREAASGHERP